MVSDLEEHPVEHGSPGVLQQDPGQLAGRNQAAQPAVPALSTL